MPPSSTPPVTGRTTADATTEIVVKILDILGKNAIYLIVAVAVFFGFYKYVEQLRHSQQEQLEQAQATQKEVRSGYSSIAETQKQQIENLNNIITLHNSLVAKSAEEFKKTVDDLEANFSDKRKSETLRSDYEKLQRDQKELQTKLVVIENDSAEQKEKNSSLTNQITKFTQQLNEKEKELTENKKKLSELIEKSFILAQGVLVADADLATRQKTKKIAKQIETDYGHPWEELDKAMDSNTPIKNNILDRLVGQQYTAIHSYLADQKTGTNPRRWLMVFSTIRIDQEYIVFVGKKTDGYENVLFLQISSNGTVVYAHFSPKMLLVKMPDLTSTDLEINYYLLASGLNPGDSLLDKVNQEYITTTNGQEIYNIKQNYNLSANDSILLAPDTADVFSLPSVDLTQQIDDYTKYQELRSLLHSSDLEDNLYAIRKVHRASIQSIPGFEKISTLGLKDRLITIDESIKQFNFNALKKCMIPDFDFGVDQLIDILYLRRTTIDRIDESSENMIQIIVKQKVLNNSSERTAEIQERRLIFTRSNATSNWLLSAVK